MTQDEDNKEAVRKSRDVKNVGQRRIMIALAMVFLLSVVAVASGGLISYVTLRSTAEDGTVLAQQIQKACASPARTSQDLSQFCLGADKVVKDAPAEVKMDPVPGPAGATGSQGATGAQGDTGPAPSDAQILVAVKSFCTSTGKCRGVDGANATPAQVAIAVSSYCDSRGQCRGSAGTAGVNGTNGTNGTNAPPITQAQLVTAVETFCSQNNNCQGKDGTNGTDGQDGADSTVPGPAGVVAVVDNCDAAPEGQFIVNVDPSYDLETKTVTITCQYAPDRVGGILQNGS